MSIDTILQRCTVIGAAGKMGRGIALLLAQYLAQNTPSAHLTLIDQSSQALEELKAYLMSHLCKLAERHNLQKNFADNAFSQLSFHSSLEEAKGSQVVFEATLEDLQAKQTLFRQLNKCCAANCYFLSNTSSLPIGILEDSCELQGRLIGFHFYNPPPVQKLVEIITTSKTKPELIAFAENLGRQLNKILIPSNDTAGFIGNGHFMRDLLYACSAVDSLSKECGEAGAIYIIQRVSRDFLIRPMGIFQLADYVGLDVCRNILTIMNQYIEKEELHSPLLNRCLEQRILGGQNPDGSQKDGLLKYAGKEVEAIYDTLSSTYVDCFSLSSRLDPIIGDLPAEHFNWKELLKDEQRTLHLEQYFEILSKASGLGANLARRYLDKSQEIALNLVEDGVAHSVEDVNSVLQHGFYHLYGAVRPATVND